MPNTHHYISCFDTSSGTYHMYHNNVILFSGKELSDLIFPGLFHELKSKTKFHTLFVDKESSPSRYKLPSFIDCDKLLSKFRDIIPRSLVFIHTWMREHTQFSDDFLELFFDTYQSFFEHAFSKIISSETNTNVRDIAVDLSLSMKQIYPYLGSYQGSLANCVYRTNDIIAIMLMLTCFLSKSYPTSI